VLGLGADVRAGVGLDLGSGWGSGLDFRF